MTIPPPARVHASNLIRDFYLTAHSIGGLSPELIAEVLGSKAGQRHLEHFVSSIKAQIGIELPVVPNASSTPLEVARRNDYAAYYGTTVKPLDELSLNDRFPDPFTAVIMTFRTSTLLEEIEAFMAQRGLVHSGLPHAIAVEDRYPEQLDSGGFYTLGHDADTGEVAIAHLMHTNTPARPSFHVWTYGGVASWGRRNTIRVLAVREL